MDGPLCISLSDIQARSEPVHEDLSRSPCTFSNEPGRGAGTLISLFNDPLAQRRREPPALSSRVGTTLGSSPTCVRVMSQDPASPLPHIPFSSHEGDNWGSERRDGGEERNSNSASFESGSSELCVWGKFLWILIQIYIPRVWGSDIYIYKYAHIFHSIWKVFDARKMEMEKPSDAVLKLEAAAKLLREPAQSVLLSGLQTF